MATIILYAIIAFILLEFIVSNSIDLLNLKTWDKPIPEVLRDLYDEAQYKKAKDYAKANAKLKAVSGTFSLVLIVAFLWLKGFAWINNMSIDFTENVMLQSLVFFAIIAGANYVLQLPFSLYGTFVIEQKFGFNKTTLTTYIVDTVKTIALGVIIGGGLLALLAYLFYWLGGDFWIAGWIVLSAFTLFFAAFYTSLLLPVFNKLSPLEAGDLRSAIEKYALKVAFPLTNIFVIDGSKRSSKANAFFSGLGGKKNIVLYDTLIKDLTQEEITAVLAHEVGHYKRKHVQKSMILSVLQIGIMFFVFGWLASNPIMAEVLGAKENNFHLSLITFSLLFSPISLATGILMNIYSRKNEYEADAYAKETFDAVPLITALKKLTVNHLGNPQPHPAFIFLHYSHPTLLQRIEAMQ